ncbi:beta-ketoacyl synthase N-terminal-like domain-containing protein [Paenibacillus amylolyticus]|uniref:beta-ketoacyl synthase N-terminal-like domain-containing protein n=1 Tax=Paenibacillus amylolyticus TaxID=1451 RepID=UPI003EB786C8
MEKVKRFILQQVASQSISNQEGVEYIQELMEGKKRASQSEDQSFAIIGMSCRFPKANSLEEFWDMLIHGTDAIGSFPESRKDDVLRVKKEIFDRYKDIPLRLGGYLDRIDQFNPAFFHITPAEAVSMDPNQRLFLQVVWEAIENAGYTKEKLNGSRTAVFLGHSAENVYKELLPNDDPNVVIGNLGAVIASRVSYFLNLKGPSIVIDTTCSSSLVALDQACRSIATGESDAAIVGGISTILLPVFSDDQKMGNESSDGRCRSFDASANGTNVGEGAGVVIIKKLSDAVREKDHIYAVIKGSAVNSDGRSNGITSPNPEAQVDLLTSAWEQAGVDPNSIQFIEAHGTGTKLGDPIEAQAMMEAFNKYTERKQFCSIASVKTNIGHLDAAAGMAGLIKTALSIYYKKIPASLHYHTPNPLINFEQSAIRVNHNLTDWLSDEGPRRAGVSSFGISGTNCHVVLEEAPTRSEPLQYEGLHVFTLSAKNDKSLVDTLYRYSDFLGNHVNFSLTEICYTSNMCRDHDSHRIAIITSSIEDLSKKISELCVTRDNYEEVMKSLSQQGVYYAIVDDQKLKNSSALEKAQLNRSQCELVAECYTKGTPIDWDFWYEQKTSWKIPLPSYAFDLKRYWPPLEVNDLDSPKRDVSQFLFTPDWIQKDPVQKQISMEKQGLWMLFSDEGELSKTLRMLLEKREQIVIELVAGESFLQISENKFIINASDKGHYVRLVESLGVDRIDKIRGVLHMWTVHPEDDSMESLESMNQSQYRGSYSALYLMKALGERQVDAAFQFNVITSYAHLIDGTQEQVYPVRATLPGLVKVISQEYPKISSLTVDVDAMEESVQQIADQVMMELLKGRNDRDEVVVYRKGKRYTPILKRTSLDQVPDRQAPFKKDGVYVIAGAGYLGVEVAKYIARKGQAKLIMLNRSTLPPRDTWDTILRSKDENIRLFHQITGFQEIERSGSEIEVMTVDVTNHESLSKALDDIRIKFGRIDGVIFAIKQIYGKTIADLADGQFEEAVMSKLHGSWLLDQLTIQDKLDFFITMSSISSIMGGPKNGDCTTVNAYLDSYGDYRTLSGRETITLNLTEILTGDKHEYLIRDTIIPPLNYENFIESFEQVMNKQMSLTVISDFDLQVTKNLLPMIKIRFSDELLQEIEESDLTREELGKQQIFLGEISYEELVLKLHAIWMDVLGYEKVDVEANFFDIGGTSLSAVKLIRLINSEVSESFEVGDLYSFPTIASMADYLLSQVVGVVQEVSAGSETNYEILDVLDDLDNDDISLDEALMLIQKKQ